MKKLPVGLQDFRKLRTQGYLYVDKTRYLYELAKEMTPFFLSRPRRFGKSLTVSTLKYLFQGEKALFQDTWVYDRWGEAQSPLFCDGEDRNISLGCQNRIPIRLSEKFIDHILLG